MVVAPNHVLRDGVGIDGPVGQFGADLHEAVRVRVGERLQQDLIYHAEDAGVSADAYGEGGKSDERETWIFAKRSQSLPDVGKCCFHEWQSFPIPITFSD